jgi:hypothetical protein
MNRALHGAAHHARMTLRSLWGRFGNRRRVRGQRNVIDAGEAVLRNVSMDVEGDARC